MKEDLYIIYHSMCNDGIAAAWVAWMFCKDTRNCIFIAGDYKEGLTDTIFQQLIGKDVVIVDFSYSPDEMKSLVSACNSVLLIDHHKGAIDNLGNFNAPNLTKVLDSSMSGAVLTWVWFAELKRLSDGADFKQAVPEHLRLVDDYDRWIFDLEKTKPFHAVFTFYKDYFRAHGGNLLPIFTQFLSRLNNTSLDHFIAEGRLLERSKMLQCESMLAGDNARLVKLQGRYNLLACNADMRLASELGNSLLKGSYNFWDVKVSCIYAFQMDGVKLSFRSAQPEDSEVNEHCAIFHARYFGGNGHLNAAGVFVKRNSDKYFEFIRAVLTD
jgi:oligoribonuclease NrnB/cAMP/cGMP phosphodiesterase (DHH superfamily)